jgi:putative SOS response-associated peptidase YedK
MCGRYVSPDDAAIEREFNLVHSPGFEVRPSYNVAPTQVMPVVRAVDGVRKLSLMRWGLVPFFAKGIPGPYSTINARIETIETSASFRGPWKRGQRCIVPAAGFYEWVRHEVASVIVRRTPFGRTCRPIGSTLRGMAAWQRAV